MIDSAVIEVRAGKGGDGKVMFRREAHVPRGGPAGGDGGNGGSVYLLADAEINTMQRFRYQTSFKAESGTDGAARNMHGKNGEDLEVKVPVGTEVWELAQGAEVRLADLTAHGQRLIVAKGGAGGWGNARFASSTNQTPLLAEEGEEGERRRLKLELKVLGDVGLVGMPNAGKSSILAAVSAARPKIAEYPFTTLEPALGVVYRGHERFTVVDIPGLIEGAHEGHGLGIDFLKHIERCRVLVHVVDGSADDPLSNILLIDRELEEFGQELSTRPQIIALNKIDIEGAKRPELEADLRQRTGMDRKVLFVSAATHEGMDELVAEMWRMFTTARLDAAQPGDISVEDLPVLRPRPVDGKVNVVVEGEGAFRIVHPWAVRLAKGSRLDDWTVRVQYHARLGSMKIIDELHRLGIKPGDRVLVADREFIWE